MTKIAVFAGHGGSDPGAVSGSLREKDFTLAVALKVSDILRTAGYAIVNNRTTDINRSINADAIRANAANVSAVLDIHLNAGGGTGTEVFHSIVGGTGRTLATAIVNNIAALGFRNRGAKTKRNNRGTDFFGIIRQTRAPAVLIETAFIDNAADMARFNSDQMARAIADGVMQVLPIGGAAPTPSRPTPANPHPEPTTNIRRGHRGDGVRWVQQALLNRGFSVGRHGVDGIFGPDTDAGVRAFQRDRRLVVDGIVGPITRGALR